MKNHPFISGIVNPMITELTPRVNLIPQTEIDRDLFQIDDLIMIAENYYFD